MSDLIDRKALKEAVDLKLPLTNHTTNKIIDAQPAVDAVEVVRCKDCKYLMFSDFYGECGQGYLGIVIPADYCLRGERRTDGN